MLGDESHPTCDQLTAQSDWTRSCGLRVGYCPASSHLTPGWLQKGRPLIRGSHLHHAQKLIRSNSMVPTDAIPPIQSGVAVRGVCVSFLPCSLAAISIFEVDLRMYIQNWPFKLKMASPVSFIGSTSVAGHD